MAKLISKETIYMIETRFNLRVCVHYAVYEDLKRVVHPFYFDELLDDLVSMYFALDEYITPECPQNFAVSANYSRTGRTEVVSLYKNAVIRNPTF